MSLPAAFRRHGTFIYNAREAIKTYGSAVAVAEEIARCKMSAAWLRIHGRRDDFSTDAATQDLLRALRDRRIAVAGWGWCQGDDPAAEAQLALRSLRGLDLVDYVADIEEGVRQAHWTPAEVETFLGSVRDSLPAEGTIAVSSFAVITWHSPKLMRAADPLVNAFAPQTYWFHFPNAKMRKQFGSGYSLDNAASYVDLCIANWRSITDKPLLTTGQAYWGEGISREESEAKVSEFLAAFRSWSDVVGFNWWHFGGGSAMSANIRAAIAAAALDGKPFATP